MITDHRTLPSLHPAQALLALTLATWFPTALAIDRGVSPAGIAYASGGVGHSELQELHAERGRYSFWLTTAALRSGAHLADVDVRITPLRGAAPVLELRMGGPWLFAALPPGRYSIEAAYRATAEQPLQVRRAGATIQGGDRRQMVLYFDTGDEVGPENHSPFKTSPYSAPSARPPTPAMPAR
jgi:hypothetical protein